MVWLKTLIFTIIVPGAIMALIPYLLLSRTPPSFAQIGPFVVRARKSGAPVEYVTFPNEGHGNRLPKNQQRYLDEARRWFRRYLHPWDFRDNPKGEQVA